MKCAATISLCVFLAWLGCERKTNERCCSRCGTLLAERDQAEPYTGADPSRTPRFDGNGKCVPQFRFLADFNADGLEDVALSVDRRLFLPERGGAFFIYLNDSNGVYHAAGTFVADPYPEAVAIERTYDLIRVWSYTQTGTDTGLLYCRPVESTHPRKSKRLELHLGAGAFGQAMKEAVSENSIELARLEYSTHTDGVLAWVPIPPKIYQREDPSLTPRFVNGRFQFQYRLIGDFNGDGFPDVAISADTKISESDGGIFKLYCQTRGGYYRDAGDLQVHPRTVAIETAYWGANRIWSRWRNDETLEQGLFITEIKDGKLGTCQRLELSRENQEFSDALMKAPFPHLPQAQLEYSIYTNGVVTWLPIPPNAHHPYLGSDPSRIPLMSNQGFQRQCRLLADFDGDGRGDIALSTDGEKIIDTSHGGRYTLFLQTPEGLYQEVGIVSLARLDNIRIEYIGRPTPFSRVWSYGYGAEFGWIWWQNIMHRKLSEDGNLHLDFTGSNAVRHKAIFDAVRNCPSTIRMEYNTYTNGAVMWHPFPSAEPEEVNNSPAALSP
jgi:hypothetical protein